MRCVRRRNGGYDIIMSRHDTALEVAECVANGELSELVAQLNDFSSMDSELRNQLTMDFEACVAGRSRIWYVSRQYGIPRRIRISSAQEYCEKIEQLMRGNN